MNPDISWFFKIVRMAGSSFPGSASLVQFQAELDSSQVSARLEKLEDPISNLHIDVKAVSKIIYSELKSKDYIFLELEDVVYQNFSRAIAALGAAGLLDIQNSAGASLPDGISLSDPSYIMYLCNLFEDSHKMEELIGLVDGCMIGEWMDGKDISESIELPVCVVCAVFRVYEAKGFGCISEEVGECSYVGQA